MQRLKWRRSAERAQGSGVEANVRSGAPRAKLQRPPKQHHSHAQTERSPPPALFTWRKAPSLREVEGDDPLRLPHGHVRLAPGTSRPSVPSKTRDALPIFGLVRDENHVPKGKEDPRNYVRKLENKQILARFLRFQPFIFSKRMQTPQISGSRGALPRFQEPLAYKILPHPAVEVALDPKTHPNSTRFHLEKLGILSTGEPETLQIKPSDTTRAPIATSGGRSKCTTSGCHFL